MRIVAAVVFGALCGLAAGCGAEKQLPKGQAGTPPDARGGEPEVPAASDPKAREVVDRALRAAGDPAKVARLRTSKATFSGMMKRAAATGEFAAIKTTSTTDAVWPDRARVEYRFEAAGMPPMAIGFRRPVVWTFVLRDNARWEEVPAPDPGDVERQAMTDMTSTYWMPLLVPLLDPRTVVFEPRTVTTGPQPAEVVKAHVPGCPVFTLWFDPATNFLRRVDCTRTDRGQRVADAVILDGHKPFDGVTAPGKMLHERNNVGVEEWTLDALDFPEKIDEARFDPPKDDKK